MYTVVESGIWVIEGEMPSDGDHDETIEVGLVCYRNDIVTVHSWFGE